RRAVRHTHGVLILRVREGTDAALPDVARGVQLTGVAMEILHNLILGFGVAVSPINLLYALIGVLLGTLIGVLPGIGPVATIAMLLPITYGVPPVSALIMLAGIYYGAQYGGSTTSLLVNLPGQPASAC